MRVTEKADSSKCQLWLVPGGKMLMEAAPCWYVREGRKKKEKERERGGQMKEKKECDQGVCQPVE